MCVRFTVEQQSALKMGRADTGCPHTAGGSGNVQLEDGGREIVTMPQLQTNQVLCQFVIIRYDVVFQVDNRWSIRIRKLFRHL